MTFVNLPPTQMELPSDDGVPMETQRHKVQMDLLIDALLLWLDGRQDGYVGGNMFVYYSLAQVRNQDFKGPDVFVALGVPKGERRSWVCWEEGKGPDVVIELISESTAAADKGNKMQIYQNQLHLPEYFWFDPFDPEDWAGFQLQGGQYQPILPNAQDQLVSRTLSLALVRWYGTYKGIETTWLRWANLNNTLLPTAEEYERIRTAEAQQQAAAAQQEATAAQQRADRLAERLRQMGIDPDQI